jgi:transcriptional regulator with PAS, ATPase and Fis domain
MKKIKDEAPAIRIKEVDGSQNVIGMAAPKIQLIVAVETMEEGAKKELISHIIKTYHEHPKVQITMVKSGDCDSAECKNKDYFRVVYDEEKTFISKYFKAIADEFKGGLVVIDTEGAILYIAEFTEGLADSIETLDSITTEACKEKKGAHKHENWMRV